MGGIKDDVFGYFKTKKDNMIYWKDAGKFSDDPEMRELIDRKWVEHREK